MKNLGMLPFRAMVFAVKAHDGQYRKYTKEPYVLHPIKVALTVRDYGGTDEMIAAAMLHDVVEDTPATLEEVTKEFGTEVGGYVYWLTDVSSQYDGIRAVRKEMDRNHIARASPEAKTIKLADLLDNTASIVEHDPDFAVLYMREKAAMMKVLTEGNPLLYQRVQQTIGDYHAANNSMHKNNGSVAHLG